MNRSTNKTVWAAECIALSAVLGFAGTASAQSYLVSPLGLENVEGESGNLSPFGGTNPSQRHQQVYANSEFAGYFAPLIITEIAFRPDGDGTGFAFSSVLADVQINMSTTAVEPDDMSLFFDDRLGFVGNVGPDDTVVVDRGPLALSSANTGPIGGPKDFDIVVPFDTPFTYDPAAGNLLLDVRIFDAGTTTTQFDAQSSVGDGTSRAFTLNFGDVNSLVSDGRSSLGLVTRFTIIPEPAALPLLAVAALSLRPRRRA